MGMVIDAVTVLNVAVIPKACSFKLAGSSNQKAIAVWRSNHLSGHAFPNAGGIAILQTLPRHAIERHNILQTQEISKERLESTTSRWILSCFSKILCISIGMRVTNL
jgi:hypothetical protein